MRHVGEKLGFQAIGAIGLRLRAPAHRDLLLEARVVRVQLECTLFDFAARDSCRLPLDAFVEPVLRNRDTELVRRLPWRC
jgi:hypothetical protein